MVSLWAFMRARFKRLLRQSVRTTTKPDDWIENYPDEPSELGEGFMERVYGDDEPTDARFAPLDVHLYCNEIPLRQTYIAYIFRRF